MKTLALLLAFTIGIIHQALCGPLLLPLKVAVDKGLVGISIRGMADPETYVEIVDKEGLFFGKCITLSLKSKTDSALILKLDAGTLLIPKDSTVQTMLVTHGAWFPLEPGEQYVTRLYAMCAEIHDQVPTYQTPFNLGGMGDKSMVALAQYIEQHYLQNIVGQHAVWAYTDQSSLEELTKYGATDFSIGKTHEILSALKINTAISPVLVTDTLQMDAKNTGADEASDKAAPAAGAENGAPGKNGILVSKPVAYGAAGAIVVLSFSTLVLFFKRRPGKGNVPV